jgi:hypothetical protein
MCQSAVYSAVALGTSCERCADILTDLLRLTCALICTRKPTYRELGVELMGVVGPLTGPRLLVHPL